MNKPLKLIAIQTKDKVYISDNFENSSYFNTKIKSLIFDGVKPTDTYINDWFEISCVPVVIQRELPAEQINIRYELKPTLYNTGLPKVLKYSDFDEDTGQYESVYGLYERKYDLTEPRLEEVAFELHVIAELEDFELVRSDYQLQHLSSTESLLIPSC